METIVGNVDNVEFLFEAQLEEQAGIEALPFSGMDSKCVFFMNRKS